MINHIVLFKFKYDTAEEQIERVNEGLLGLKYKIYGIESITIGKNNSTENKNHGFSYGFVMRFKDESCRDIYLWHPEHRWIVENDINPIKEDVLVLDYNIQK